MIKHVITLFMSLPLTGSGAALIFIGLMSRSIKPIQNPIAFKKELQNAWREPDKEMTVDDFNIRSKKGGMILIVFGIISILIALFQSIFSK